MFREKKGLNQTMKEMGCSQNLIIVRAYNTNPHVTNKPTYSKFSLKQQGSNRV